MVGDDHSSLTRTHAQTQTATGVQPSLTRVLSPGCCQAEVEGGEQKPSLHP